jgi:hypothetical protein
MQYLLTIYSDPDLEPTPADENWEQYMQGYFTMTEQARESGALVAGDALQGVETATTVRVRDGLTVTTDGPFAETKEQLGGYYLLECADLDEAIAWAEKIPGSRCGSVEIRPIMVFD